MMHVFRTPCIRVLILMVLWNGLGTIAFTSAPLSRLRSHAVNVNCRTSRFMEKVSGDGERVNFVNATDEGFNDTVYISDTVNGYQENNNEKEEGRGNAICRVVALSDGKIPSQKSKLPESLLKPPFILQKMDAIYHATAHAETSRLKYMDGRLLTSEKEDEVKDEDAVGDFNEQEEKELISVLRTSLEDAGFELLTRRDLDLCEALNAGYLLRLSILPDVSKLDPSISQEFYPELFSKNGTALKELLFDGRVLVFRRGYSSEVTRGRLLLPKLDFLQAGLVQTAAAAVTERLGQVEREILKVLAKEAKKVQRAVRYLMVNVLIAIPSNRITKWLREKWGLEQLKQDIPIEEDTEIDGENLVFKLGRYGGSKIRFVGSPNPSDALTPFMICELNEGPSPPCPNANGNYLSSLDEKRNVTIMRDVDHDMYENLNQGVFSCQYDAEKKAGKRFDSPSVQLLKRISLSNVVDLFSKQGRSTLVKRFFEKSKLVEPTYKEVVVVWRDLPEKPKRKPSVKPPKFVYDAAEIFGVEDRLPERADPEPTNPTALPLEIRAFDDVPMANLPAVFPKTKLIFRPADAFVFDLISILSLVAVLGSQKFDNPKLDVLAVISVTLWIIRTFFRYSNKLARYDLLVKSFLTSKIAHRGPGALKYITSQAGSQRALRAALIHHWLLGRRAVSKSLSVQSDKSGVLDRTQILREDNVGVNELIDIDRNVDIDIDAALNDLVDLNLITFSPDGEQLVDICDERDVENALKTTWNDIFDGDLSLNSLVGRRIRQNTIMEP